MITAGWKEKTVEVVLTEPTPTLTPTPIPSPSASPSKRWIIPGFDAVFAIAGLLAVAYLVLRERGEIVLDTGK